MMLRGKRIGLLALALVSLHTLSACTNDESESGATTPTVNLTLILNEIMDCSQATGIVQLSGTNIPSTQTALGVCYSATTSLPTIADACVTVNDVNGVGNYDITISALQELTTYYARPYLYTQDDVFYGQTLSFRTLGSSEEYYPTAKGASPTMYEGYTLKWADEFDEDGRPSDAWSYEIGFQRNEELQWYQEDNATVKNGCLIIEGRQENVINPNYVAQSEDWRTNRPLAEYTSSCVTTQHSYTFMYGLLEVRAKIPTTMGSWPAIWTLGNIWEWPMNGEIDLLEFYLKNGVPSIFANACWSSNEKWTAVWDDTYTPLTHFLDKDPEWANKFHLWRMDWDKEHIRLYLDDELLNEIDLSTTYNQGYEGNYINPFNTDYPGFGDYILLNLAIGSNGGTPDNTKFPLKYWVDYVRVYQKL